MGMIKFTFISDIYNIELPKHFINVTLYELFFIL